MKWRVPRIWEGGDVWIIGGGPSITKQFEIPEKVVQDVLNGVSPPSVYSPYMEAIHKKHVIGVNIAYMLGNWIDMIVFGDNSFYLAHQEDIRNFPGLKVSCHPCQKGEQGIKYLDRDTNYGKGMTDNPSKVSWNGNSGSAAINIAVHTGAKRIILLGFDMNLSTQKFQHWHDAYHRGPVDTNDKRRNRKLPFEKHLIGFPDMARDAKRRGVEIINASPDSKITCFRKTSVKELLS